MKRRLAALMRTAASVLRLRDQHGRPALILHPCFTQRSATADRTGAPRSQVQSGRRRRMRPGHAPWRIAATVITGMLAGGALASSASAARTLPTCPDTVIPNVPIIPNAVGCWNAIAVQTIRLAAPYQVQGLLYMGYIQAAVYDAVTKIDGRYVPYHEFAVTGRRGRRAARRPTPPRPPRHTRC